MPLFISDEELRLLDGDAAAVAERADAAIHELRRQVDTVRAESDAAAIAAEQTCALLEQRYATLSAEFDRSQAEAAELASSQAEIHQLRIQAIAKDSEVERLKVEISELHKSKCQSLELIEQRDAEIKEKDDIIQSYYQRIVNLPNSSATIEARIQEVEAKFTHCQAMCNRITQEKELLEKHNLWLDEELEIKVKNLAEIRKTNMDEEARMPARISEVMKLAELHKESSEEWSKKAGELEGVIKALETHLSQVEDEYKEKLEKEALSRRDLEKVLHEIEEKAELVLDERAEHESMVEAYALMDQKLQQALLEHDNFENTIRNLKSELKRRECDHSVALKEIDDLQKQVTVLLKECQDIQLRCGSSLPNVGNGAFSASIGSVLSNVEHNINDNMAFKDINGFSAKCSTSKSSSHALS
ncbi:unnamed protein product [Urochloa humidicola]